MSRLQQPSSKSSIFVFGFSVGFFFCTVESRFLELDGDATNYEDSRYRGRKYKKKKRITNKPI